MTAAAGRVAAADLRELIAALSRGLFDRLELASDGRGAESVHQSRIAARTLRSVLGTLEPMLAPRLLARARRDLRNLALELEEMREADVRHDWLTALAAASHSLPPARQRQLRLALERERRRARDRFRGIAASVAWRERLLRLEATLTHRRLVAATGDVGPEVRQRVAKRWKRLVRCGRSMRSHDPDSVHELRLAAKHARYASESLMPLVGLEPRTAVKSLKRLQGVLGEHRDARLSLDWLRGLGQPLSPLLLPPLEQPARRVMARRERQLDRLLARLAPPDLAPAGARDRREVSRARRRSAGRSARSSGPPRRRSRPS